MVPIVEEIRSGSPIITEDSQIGNEFADVDNADEYFFQDKRQKHENAESLRTRSFFSKTAIR